MLFCRKLLASEEMRQFNKARIFLDEDFTAVDKFTVRQRITCMSVLYLYGPLSKADLVDIVLEATLEPVTLSFSQESSLYDAFH